MTEYGTSTIRSAHPLNIFRKERERPLWVIEGASEREGKRIIARHSIEPDGQWRGGSETVGNLADERDGRPYFYLYFLGGEMAMNESDMKEVIAGMRERNKERIEREARPLPDLKRMRDQIREVQRYINEKRRGVTRFAGVEVPT